MIGMKVAKKNKSLNSPFEKDLALFTNYPLLKVAKEGTGSVNFAVNDIDANTKITHNLGYKPLVMCYIQVGNVGDSNENKYQKLLGGNPFYYAADDGYDAKFGMDISNTDITVAVYLSDNTPTVRTYNFQYYIMYDDTGL